ncbi:histone deacetylase complex protein [Mycena rebaudengoi]|nr:histone deacetylase complex protein [Mycena rebaudengoi]
MQLAQPIPSSSRLGPNDFGDSSTRSHSTGPAAPPVSKSPVPRASSVPLHHPNATVGFVHSSEMATHCSLSPEGHPEAPERISRIWNAIVAMGYNMKARKIPIRPVRKEEVLLVHSEDLWDKVEALQHMTTQDIVDSEQFYEQLSLYISKATTRSARLSCGGVVEACLAVARGELKKTFAVVRPPGHHAEPEEHMGFCFFNNVAVAARVVQQVTPLKRILILDWDVHHGNGTQRAFNDDPSVLYISIHRYERGEFYPCGPFGGLQSCGEGPGLGYSVNIPWPECGMGDADYILAFQKIVMPIALEFAPELVIKQFQAGFDAAAGDDLGECYVSPEGYAQMTYMLSGLAGGRLVVALEGGYNLDSITNSALAVTRILLGEPPEEMPSMVASEAAAETIWLVAKEQSKYWKNVDPKACEAHEDAGALSFSVTEILKLHRQYYLYSKHDMMQVPLVNPELETRFSAQMNVHVYLFQKDTLVMMVHELGNLRVELASSLNCDVQLERSYLIDFSKDLVAWVKAEGYALLDINLFPHPLELPFPRPKSLTELRTEAVTYLWDNYVQLSNASTIVLIGHGPGCQPLMDLINLRATSAMKSVKAVVQVVGHSPLEAPKNVPDLREWYRENSFVALPATHQILSYESRARELKRHGHLYRINEEQSVKLVIQAMPAIKEFIKSRVGSALPQNAMSSMHLT